MTNRSQQNADRSPLTLAIALVLTLATALPATALPATTDLGVSTPDSEQSDSRVDSSLENYCIGGLENRKLIPQSGQVSNPFRQTTVLGCSVDGGVPTIMPDLIPAIRDGKLA